MRIILVLTLLFASQNSFAGVFDKCFGTVKKALVEFAKSTPREAEKPVFEELDPQSENIMYFQRMSARYPIKKLVELNGITYGLMASPTLNPANGGQETSGEIYNLSIEQAKRLPKLVEINHLVSDIDLTSIDGKLALVALIPGKRIKTNGKSVVNVVQNSKIEIIDYESGKYINRKIEIVDILTSVQVLPEHQGLRLAVATSASEGIIHIVNLMSSDSKIAVDLESEMRQNFQGVVAGVLGVEQPPPNTATITVFTKRSTESEKWLTARDVKLEMFRNGDEITFNLPGEEPFGTIVLHPPQYKMPKATAPASKSPLTLWGFGTASGASVEGDYLDMYGRHSHQSPSGSEDSGSRGGPTGTGNP